MTDQELYYCTGCGKPRPLVAGYLRLDDGGRYVLVQCGRVRRAGTQDRALARRVIRDRRRRRKERLRARREAEARPGWSPA